MKKIILSIFLIALSFNTTQAGVVDCKNINQQISKYSVYQQKIDTIFKNILEKDTTEQKIFYSKINDVTEQYIEKTTPGSKVHTIIGYLYCENESSIFSIEQEHHSTAYNLEDVLSTIKKKAQTYKNTTVIERKGKIYFERPLYVVGSEIHDITINDLKDITGIQNLPLNSLSESYNGPLGLHSAYIKGKYLFLELQANQAGGTYRFYIIMDQNAQIKDFRGIDTVGNKTILWNNNSNTSYILDTYSDNFNYNATIQNLAWKNSDYISSKLVVIHDGVAKYGLVGNYAVYDFKNQKQILLKQKHNLIVFGEGLNVLEYNHKIYNFELTSTSSSQCNIQAVQYSFDHSNIVYGDNKPGYCQPEGFFSYYFTQTSDESHSEENIRAYYDLIEKGELEAAFERKIFEKNSGESDMNFQKRYNQALNNFKYTYHFKNDVEINLTHFKKISKNIYQFDVGIIYSLEKQENYTVKMEVLSFGIRPKLKTLSVQNK